MKTKNIFKALALAMLMPAMLLTTACSNDDDVVNNAANTENTINKGYALPVTVNVTRQGDAATRATYNESTKKLSFSAGDKLLVRGNDNSEGGAGRFAGMLDYDASEGNFSGTIYTENSYSGTADALFTAATANWVGAALFPNGYDTYEFLSISGSGYNTSYSMSYNKAIAATKATAVEQFSLETAKTYSSGFTLSPQNAILNFTITGLTDGAKAVTLKNGTKTMFTGSVTPTSGTAAFALGARLDDPVNLKNVTLTIGGTDIAIISTHKYLEAGKIYNITRSTLTYPIALSAVTSSYVGSVVTTDGNLYATVADATAASRTAVAKIIYVTSTGHGLALALEDEGWVNWSTAKTTCEAHTPAVTGGTWQLPSQEDWNNMITAAGSYTALRDGFSSFGGTNMKAGTYWSSTDAYTIGDLQIKYGYKFNEGSWGTFGSTGNQNTRACLAF